MKTYWSNCLIEALRLKFLCPKDIEIKILFFRNHFHVLWYDKKNYIVRHFTHRKIKKMHSNILFKGHIEELSINAFNKYCKKRHCEHLIINIDE